MKETTYIFLVSFILGILVSAVSFVFKVSAALGVQTIILSSLMLLLSLKIKDKKAKKNESSDNI